ncbi:hypothetical protein D3C72_66380 [compost metagenome]
METTSGLDLCQLISEQGILTREFHREIQLVVITVLVQSTRINVCCLTTSSQLPKLELSCSLRTWNVLPETVRYQVMRQWLKSMLGQETETLAVDRINSLLHSMTTMMT